MPEIDPSKYTVIYLWDSTMYDFMLEDAMKGFDSLAHAVGRKRINYVFVTEMEDSEAKEYLKRKGFVPTTFSVAGDMDDFVSGIFNEKPSKIKMVYLNNKSKSSNPPSGMPKFKSKPMYLVLNPVGKIIFYDNRYIWPKTDTAFIRILDLLNHGEKILN